MAREVGQASGGHWPAHGEGVGGGFARFWRRAKHAKSAYAPRNPAPVRVAAEDTPGYCWAVHSGQPPPRPLIKVS